MAVFDSEASEGDAAQGEPAEGEGSGSGMQMAFGGTFAWNQFNGQVLAYVEDSTLETTEGDLAVQAVNSAALDAQSKAGTAVSSGAAAGASLAFNAVGWDMGNIAAAGLNSILGTDIGATASPLLTHAYVRGSDVTVAGEMSVTAENTMGIEALISNAADVLGGGAGGMSVGAAMILASNRVRSDTRAFVDGKKQLAGADQALLDVGGGLSVSATDDAGISAEVSMSSNVAGGSGATVAAGGVFSLNDVRSQVAADAWSLTLTTGGDASITASATA
jgi:hypothetical protein